MAGWLGVTFAHARSKESGACHRAERELVLGAPVVGFGASRPCSSAGVAEVFASVSSVSLSSRSLSSIVSGHYKEDAPAALRSLWLDKSLREPAHSKKCLITYSA